MKALAKFSYVAVVLSLISCKIAPQEIQYGTDMCHSCQMTIVEQTHASQIVTKKGRAYKYDAIECMLQDLDKRDVSSIALFLVTDYTKPTTLINAKEATFLVSEEIKSPMGANLSAFSNREAIKVAGQQFNWNEINDYIQ
ncbi:nitrous oxide reductase accessory protein NosL [Tenacibaculum tangerinum]|uniref:Nitrous oxide reductase accessory protein NosL n=1 Tax=Tenacibaculum tangerinum TaxID=3038772 RepID=A0ABY8L188_9FLAO|nr:nitrous oxide reductase accessory protein NosL [Tenacibaculum tangerinum]WGH74866.1 nitrous oxide reductase accessory protein NosL [Tenacibaculum tangerinum]